MLKMSSIAGPSTGSSNSNSNVQEFSIRVPKEVQKRYHVMRFNATLDVDFSKWTQVKMERENNLKEFKGIDDDLPKFGAGSEFGREAKEEARRKKLGIITRKYKADNQPWILKSCGSTVKKFKGIREGGVSENASYYVFTHAADGAIEAFPLHEWYKFQPIQRYKALSFEEAELEFNKRNKHLNYFSLMMRKRMKGEDDADIDEGEAGKSKKGSKTKDLKISEMDEWMESSDDDSSEDEEKEKDEEEKEDKKDKKKKKQVNATKKKKQKRDTDAEALEDSDDGDEEGRELDYISDSTDSEPEETKLEGVSEEKALRKLLNSDEEDSENDSDKSDKEDEKEEDEKKEKDGEKKKEESEDKDKNKKSKKKKKDTKKEVKKEKNDKKSDDDFSSDSSTDEDIKKEKADKKAKKGEQNDKTKEKGSANNSRSGTPTADGKRKLPGDTPGPAGKKPKIETPIPNYIPGASESGITEDAVRKYLMRKPMTTTELLQKFKSKKTGLSSDQLVNIMTQILKKINPLKQTLKGKMYLSIKS